MGLFTSLVHAQPPDTLLQKLEKATGIETARLYDRIAGYYMLNRPDTCLVLARKALFINRQFRDQLLEAGLRGKIAEAYSYLSEYDSSVMYYLQAIKLAEHLNNPKKISSFYNGLGIVFYHTGDYRKAINYMKQAAAIQLNMGETVHYATILCNIAGVMMVTGEGTEAIAMLHDAEKKLRHGSNKGILANLYNTLGSIYQQGFQNLDSAGYYYNKNISMIDEPGLEAFRLAAYRNAGEIYLQKKQYEKARTYLNTALRLSLALERNTERISIYGSLSDLFVATGLFKEAYDYKTRQMALHDSLFNEQKETIVHRLEAQYQVEKKDLRIKAQELLLQKEQNRQNIIVFMAVVAILLLGIVALYFWQKKRAKEELEKTKSRIFQNIVHEIRTPLTLITGPLALLKGEQQNETSRQQFERIEQNAGKLVDLVNELLLAAKLEKGELEITYAVGDLVAFTRQLVDAFEDMAREHNVTLVFEVSSPSLVMPFAAAAYEKIAANLISNAIKYNRPDGQVNIILHSENECITLKVTDTGTGMSKKETEKLFERFYRSPEQKNKPGFGIGLSVVADLVKQLNGQITVSSEPGKGSTFLVRLPQQQTSQGTDSSITDENEWVLVVEDDAGIYDFIRGVLEKKGLKVQRAVNGAQGFEMARQHLPDLVITDVMMPVEDGIGMTARLKNDELTKHIPVMMLSARAAVSSRLEGMQAGADAYLSKPFHPDELALLVQNLSNTLKQNRQQFSGSLQETQKNYPERLSGNDEYLKKIVETVDQNMLEPDFSVNELADVMCISRSQLHRKITALTGFSTTQFIRIIRLEKAKDLLLANAGNVTEIAYRCGFSSQSYFTKSFTEHFGKAPSDYLK